MTIGNASINYVTSAIGAISSGYISNDSGKITTDGNGNITVTGNVIVTGTISGTIGGSLVPTSFKFPTSAYASLPSSGNVAGDGFFVSDGQKPGETGSTTGTGVLCVYDGTNWISVSSGTTVTVATE